MLKKFIAVMLILIAFIPFGFVEAASGILVSQAENLIDNKTSSFDGIENWRETKWTNFYAGIMSLSNNGFSGACLKMETPKDTWGSPALDIFPYIKGPGQYVFSAFIKYDGEGEKSLDFILRGTKETSIIKKHGKNFFGSICVKRVKAGQWEKVTATFNVTEEDLKVRDQWNLCISVVQPDIKALYFDEVVLIRGATSDLPETPPPNEDVVFDGEQPETGEKQLYDPAIKETAIKTAIITAVIVVIVVFIKIFLHKIIRKGVKK